MRNAPAKGMGKPREWETRGREYSYDNHHITSFPARRFTAPAARTVIGGSSYGGLASSYAA
ncbi:MAG: hypothetical protein NTT76_15915, partial [Achromobacter xylosoxidans]|nr:hypothetical protein [Achromobacter xylosoxidans]